MARLLFDLREQRVNSFLHSISYQITKSWKGCMTRGTQTLGLQKVPVFAPLNKNRYNTNINREWLK